MADECCKEDDELNELLDSALEDFDKAVPSTIKQTSETASKENEAEQSTGSEEVAKNNAERASSLSAAFQGDLATALGEDYGGVAEDIGNAVKKMLEEPELLAQLDQFVQAAAQGSTQAEHGNPSSLTDLEANLARTMSHLAQNAKDIENCPTNPLNEDFFKAMSNLSLDGANEGELDFLPLMQGMMQNLLSKDVLYPALKALQEKYPKWLKDHESALSGEEHRRYSQQYKLVSEVCSEYESETSDDSEETKKKRFEKLLGLMQQMQECGQPPPDLVGEMPAAFSSPLPEMPEPPEIPDELKDECKVT